MRLNTSGINAAISPFVWVLVSAFCFFRAAGTAEIPEARMYYILAFVLTASGQAVLAVRSPDTLNMRGKAGSGAGYADKAVVAAYLAFDSAVIPAVAGFDRAGDGATLFGTSYLYLGLAVYAVSSVIAFWAMAENPFYERFSRLQRERGQRPVTSGPYSQVRHPGYLAMAIKPFSLPLMTGSGAALIVSLVPAALSVIRASREDRMLMKGLKGYREYSQKTRYMLLPWVM